MEIPSKQKIQQILINHSHDINFRKLLKICKNYNSKPYSILVNSTMMNRQFFDYFHFMRNLLERIQKLMMTNDKNIRDHQNTILVKKQLKY